MKITQHRQTRTGYRICSSFVQLLSFLYSISEGQKVRSSEGQKARSSVSSLWVGKHNELNEHVCATLSRGTFAYFRIEAAMPRVLFLLQELERSGTGGMGG
ncbi:hypothetical protein ACMFMG_010953 [Clarireedia jacksonii]